MRVLVTGHRGYIGSVLVPMLLEREHDVVGLDAGFFDACTFGAEPAIVFDDRLGDVRDIELEELVDFDAVIHLAGLSNDPLGDYDPSLTHSINSAASIRLAKLAKKAGVRRFLFASSCSNYGASGQDFLDEHSEFHPVTPYGLSKVAVEQALAPLADDHFSPVFIRASTAYGDSPRLRFDLVLNNLTAWAYATGEVFLKSDGAAWRPIVHVEDISRAYTAALEADLEVVHGQAFNVGLTSENYEIMDIALLVEKIVPGCKVTMSGEATADARCYRVDCNKIARLLHGFKPQWTAQRGIESLVDRFRTSELTMAQFEGPTYNRIEHIKSLIDAGKLTTDLRWAANTMKATL